MGYIYNTANQKVARIDDQGDVFSAVTGKHLGKVHSGGEVFDTNALKEGHIDSQGKIFDLKKQVGSVHSDGGIYDIEGHHLGRTEAPHVEFGAAAFLILVR